MMSLLLTGQFNFLTEKKTQIGFLFFVWSVSASPEKNQ